jgi:hypothetical protein
MYRPNPIAERVGGQLNTAFSTEQITEHLLTFCLAGIEAYRPWRKTRPMRTPR